MKTILAFGALAFASMASAQIDFSETHDAGSSFTGTAIIPGNPWALETNPLNAHTSDSYWLIREPGNVSDSVLTAPTLTYTAGTAGPVTLSFWHKFGFEDHFDGGTVELQVNGGAWNNIGTGAFLLNGYNDTLSVNFLNPLGGQQAFTGLSDGFTTDPSTTNWINSVANLGEFNVGDTFAIRFHAGSDVSNSGSGWLIDEVNITAAPVPEPATMAILGVGALGILRRKRRKA